MTTTLSAPSPQFQQAAVNVIGVLEIAMAQLRRMRADVDKFEDQHELLHLYSLALLASQRALHLVDEAPDEIEVDGSCPLSELLATCYDRLIEQTSGLDSFDVLEFVSEVGALCRGVRRYVYSH